MDHQRFLSFMLFTLFASSFAASAWGAEHPSAEDGIWTGTLGPHPVMACFEPGDASGRAKASAYFYIRQGKRIALIPSRPMDLKNVWIENQLQNPTGIWTINTEQHKITGVWSDAGQRNHLPIKLERFQSLTSSYSSSCNAEPEFDLFNPSVYPIVLAENILRGADQTLNGRRYRVLSALGGAVQSLELMAQSGAVATLNTLLLNELRVGMFNYLTCPVSEPLASETGNGTKSKPAKPDYNFSVAPLFWDQNWISLLSSATGYCGGAYPFNNFSHSTWNVFSGQKVNLWAWIKNSKKKDAFAEFDASFFNYAAPTLLNKIITQKAVKQRLKQFPNVAHEKDDCLDVVKSNSEYEIHLSPKGLIFSHAFAHVTQACNDDIEIPYGQLMPFLTLQGQNAVRAFRQR
jgi:hypothetical protein